MIKVITTGTNSYFKKKCIITFFLACTSVDYIINRYITTAIELGMLRGFHQQHVLSVVIVLQNLQDTYQVFFKHNQFSVISFNIRVHISRIAI